MTDELLEVADELYGLALPDFTPARDARVKALKGTDLAAPVKALRKPSLAAWVVNLLVRRDGEQVGRILEVGASLREAQAAMSGDDLRALTRQRRQVTAAITQQARSLAAESGVKVTPAVADQVEATLTAAMLDERCAQAVRSGLLVTALSTTGVGETDLSGAVAVPGALGFAARPLETTPGAAPETRPDLRVVPDPDAEAKARAAAEEALTEAEQELAEARTAYNEAADEVTKLEARALQVQSEIEELRRRLAELEATYEEADEELDEAEDARGEAQRLLDDAAAARDAAAAALERLASSK